MLQGLFEMREHVPMPSWVPSPNPMVATSP